MLLNALLAEPELREEIVPELRSFEAIGDASRRAAFSRPSSRCRIPAGGCGFDEVNARLEEADQNLLAQAVLVKTCESSREEVMAAVESMRRSEGQRHAYRIEDAHQGNRSAPGTGTRRCD